MGIEPFDWNVVVAGYWNPAILTPKGIATRLFGLDEGIPITVEVPIDGLAPVRVRHDGIIISASHGNLTLFTETPTLSSLERAMQIAVIALKYLPETPLSAAGFNIRLKLDDPPDKLLRGTDVAADKSLSDAGFTIQSRSIRRSIEYGNGLLNLDIQQGDNAETTIEFNFHLQSRQSGILCEWLETPCEKIKNTCSMILKYITGSEFEEVWQ